MHQLVSSAPHRRLRDLAKKYGPVMHLQLGQVPHVVVSSPEAALEAMKTHDILLAHRPATLAYTIVTYNCSDVATAPYGDYWRQLRKICVVELLSAKRVHSFISIKDEEVSSLISLILASSGKGSPVNLSKMLIHLTSSITARSVFGDNSYGKQKDAFTALGKRLSEVLSGFNVVDFFPSIGFLQVISGMRHRITSIHRDLDEVLQSIIDDHRARKKKADAHGGEANDLLNVLLDLQDDGDREFSLTTNNIKAIMLDMLSGGIETSSTATEWAMSELLKHPQKMKRAQAEVRQAFKHKRKIDEASLVELKYLNAVIKEALRLHPPLPLLLPREARESIKINGYDIPATTKLLVNAWAIGREPNHWIDADSFWPERFLDSPIDYKGAHFEFVPFGAGRRMCPGVAFGMSNVDRTLANLLYHFDWELINGLEPENLDMSEVFGLSVRRKDDLYLIATPYEYDPQSPI